MRPTFQILRRQAPAVLTILCLSLPCLAMLLATGKIRGTVTDTAGAPVKRAKVVAANRANGQRKETQTGPDGIYEFSDLEVGSYNLMFTRRGFSEGELTNVVVKANEPTTADITLQPGQFATLRGIVTDPSGAVIPGVTIVARDQETDEAFTTTTNNEGEYNLRIASGSYDVSATAAGFASTTQSGVEVAPSATQQVNFTLGVGPGGVDPDLDLVSISSEDLVKPSRPTVANPAEFQPPGILQVEFGYDGNFRSEETRAEHVAPLTLRFAPAERLLLEASLDTFTSRTEAVSRARETGVGDVRLEFQVLAAKESPSTPALAFAYGVKLPLASEDKGLGTGRIDHRIVVLLSKELGRTSLDFNAAALFVGRDDSDGWTNGGLVALSLSREFRRELGLRGEVSWQSKDYVQRRGVFGLGALTYKVGPRLVLDAGVRFGLNPGAPRVGVFAGFTFGLGNPFP